MDKEIHSPPYPGMIMCFGLCSITTQHLSKLLFQRAQFSRGFCVAETDKYLGIQVLDI